MKKKVNSYTNKQAIREVIGGLLQDPSLIRKYKIVTSDFPEKFHKLIFSAINNLYKNGAESIDAVAIDDYLSNYETQYQVFTKNEGVSYIEKACNVTRITATSYLNQLEDAELLVSEKIGREKIYKNVRLIELLASN